MTTPEKSPPSKDFLDWPEERVGAESSSFRWHQPGSNICLDFHGDPARAQLTVYSDGNHHMALRDCLDQFLSLNPDLSRVFYATTPPGPILKILRQGNLQMGNLVISVRPDVFISPPDVLDKLVEDGFMSGHVPLAQNQGCVILVGKGNPKNILAPSDLERREVRLFLSNPETEKASYQAYYDTLQALGPAGSGFPDRIIAAGRVVFGKKIHHREAPQAVADGSADAAVVFYHLALRYTRIFPEFFEIVPLGGDAKNPDPFPGNVIGHTSMGLVGDGGKWGEKLISFLSSRQAGETYRRHGLIPSTG